MELNHQNTRKTYRICLLSCVFFLAVLEFNSYLTAHQYHKDFYVNDDFTINLKMCKLTLNERVVD